MRIVSLLAAAAVTACTAADVQAPRAIEQAPTTGVWSYPDHAERLRASSCPEGEPNLSAQSIDLRVIQAERGSASARDRQLTGVTLAGAWQLKSKESNFGGLSGLAVMPSGSLLAISDAGAFIWIEIDAETGRPDGVGAISFMRDLDGDYFASKRDGDSEGLSLRDGMAFVSFEQDHRIAAFDLETCGSAARAAPVVRLERVVDGALLKDNRGPEALAFSGETLTAGFEMRRSGGSPIGTVNADGTLSALDRTEQPALFLMTGADARDDLTARVFRAYDPVQGPRVIVQVDRAGENIAEALLKQPLPVDNFEGVAIGEAPSGATRIWVISDDNFSNSQRTLLLALDLVE